MSTSFRPMYLPLGPPSFSLSAPSFPPLLPALDISPDAGCPSQRSTQAPSPAPGEGSSAQVCCFCHTRPPETSGLSKFTYSLLLVCLPLSCLYTEDRDLFCQIKSRTASSTRPDKGSKLRDAVLAPVISRLRVLSVKRAITLPSSSSCERRGASGILAGTWLLRFHGEAHIQDGCLRIGKILLKMKVKEESEKAGLKLNIQKTKIMASDPITSWQIDGETVGTVTDFIFLGSKITADGDYSHEIKRRLLLGRKAMTNLDSILKSRDITLPTKVRLSRLWFCQLSCMDVRVGL